MLDYRTNGYDPMPIVNKILDVDIRVKILNFCFLEKRKDCMKMFLFRQWLQV